MIRCSRSKFEMPLQSVGKSLLFICSLYIIHEALGLEVPPITECLNRMMGSNLKNQSQNCNGTNDPYEFMIQNRLKLSSSSPLSCNRNKREEEDQEA